MQVTGRAATGPCGEMSGACPSAHFYTSSGRPTDDLNSTFPPRLTQSQARERAVNTELLLSEVPAE